MKDVAALCRRVVIIAQGRIIYNGSLSGIIDRFGGQKIISVQFNDGGVPPDLERYGEVLASEPPEARLRVARSAVAEVLGHLWPTTSSRTSASRTRRWKR